MERSSVADTIDRGANLARQQSTDQNIRCEGGPAQPSGLKRGGQNIEDFEQDQFVLQLRRIHDLPRQCIAEEAFAEFGTWRFNTFGFNKGPWKVIRP